MILSCNELLKFDTYKRIHHARRETNLIHYCYNITMITMLTCYNVLGFAVKHYNNFFCTSNLPGMKM